MATNHDCARVEMFMYSFNKSKHRRPSVICKAGHIIPCMDIFQLPVGPAACTVPGCTSEFDHGIVDELQHSSKWPDLEAAYKDVVAKRTVK